MSEVSRFSEHHRINKYLKQKSLTLLKSKTIKRSSNQLSNFPIGLIIITNDGPKYEDKLEFINKYACKLFQVKDNVDINILKKNLVNI
jgi:c-di-AMP phosphodiesterase-like protein